MDLYAENILDHYRHPRGKGELKNPSVEHEEVNHSCGDAIKIQLNIKGDTVEGIAWAGTGCAISQAGISMLCEEFEGEAITAIEALSEKDIRDMFGVPIGTRRTKCALLALHTIKNALRIHSGQPVQSWLDTMSEH